LRLLPDYDTRRAARDPVEPVVHEHHRRPLFVEFEDLLGLLRPVDQVIGGRHDVAPGQPRGAEAAEPHGHAPPASSARHPSLRASTWGNTAPGARRSATPRGPRTGGPAPCSPFPCSSPTGRTRPCPGTGP